MPGTERNKILPHLSTLGFWGRRGIEILARAWKPPNQSFPVFLPAGLAGPCSATVLSVDCQLFLTSEEQEEVHMLTGSEVKVGAMGLALCIGTRGRDFRFFTPMCLSLCYGYGV